MPLRRFRSLILALSPLLAVGIIAATLALRVNAARVADMPAIHFGATTIQHSQGA
jgi:pheromone shutdown protein TraB